MEKNGGIRYREIVRGEGSCIVEWWVMPSCWRRLIAGEELFMVDTWPCVKVRIA